jgi:hypothetical protein
VAAVAFVAGVVLGCYALHLLIRHGWLQGGWVYAAVPSTRLQSELERRLDYRSRIRYLGRIELTAEASETSPATYEAAVRPDLAGPWNLVGSFGSFSEASQELVRHGIRSGSDIAFIEDAHRYRAGGRQVDA